MNDASSVAVVPVQTQVAPDVTPTIHDNQFCLIYMRTTLREGMAAFTTGGSDPLSVVDVTKDKDPRRKGGNSPLGWAYVYTGEPDASKIADPQHHRMVKWHVQRFNEEQGGIYPSHMFRVQCFRCKFEDIINERVYRETFVTGKKKFLSMCPECKKEGLVVKLLAVPDTARFNHRSKALVDHIAGAMDKQDLNWAPILPRVYGLYTGDHSKAVRRNVESAEWNPGDDDEVWMVKAITDNNKTAVLRPYSVCEELAKCKLLPYRWIMLVRETACGWIPNDAIVPVDSAMQKIHGIYRGWTIDLVSARED